MSDDIATLTARLDEAREALHRLVTGTAVQTIAADRDSVGYVPADRDALLRHIRSLERRLAVAEGRPAAAGGGGMIYVR